jgi:hypothetical protein
LIGGLQPRPALAQDPSAEELVRWLDDRERAWVATARLQATPEAAVPLLLAPDAVVAGGAHGGWTGRMLALAKIGAPAIPAITDRAIALHVSRNFAFGRDVYPLLDVLGSIGPAAAPALLRIAEASTFEPVVANALNQIIRLEGTTDIFSSSNPWSLWQPADRRADDLKRALQPHILRLRSLVEKDVGERRYDASDLRASAYLLARWGSAEDRARGIEVLSRLARGEAPNRFDFAAFRLLRTLGAPNVPELARAAVDRETDRVALARLYPLSAAIEIHRLAGRDYLPLLSARLRDERPDVRTEAIEFIASSGEIADGLLLIALLDDQTKWDGRTLGQVALHALQRLTLEPFDSDAARWRKWFDTHRNASRASLVAARVTARRATVRRVPVWTANRWIEEFRAADGAALFPLIDRYLRRRDLEPFAIGPNSSQRSGGTGPVGTYGPRVVTLLLEMAMRDVPGAVTRLRTTLTAANSEVRAFGALALAAYDRPPAVERLAIEALSADVGIRGQAQRFLLQLGDKRGVLVALNALTSQERASRLFACRDLRVYTQHWLPCDAEATASERALDAAAWRAWWERAEPTFVLKFRQATLDLAAEVSVPSVRFGNQPVR